VSYSDSLWQQFSLTDIKKPKWGASRLVSIEKTSYLIQKRFSSLITRVDLAKLCFSFETLDCLFQHCQHIRSLAVNFKYLQIKLPNKFLVDQCIHTWPVNKLEKLYLKNVCDMKTRRYNNTVSTSASSNVLNQRASPPSSYDIIEMEIIKLIRILFRRNSLSLRVLGLKCVDPNIISACVNDFGNLEIVLLNNVNDTDSVLQEIAYICKNLKCIELTKCREFQGDGLQELIEQCSNLETLQLGKHIYPALTELTEINWSNLKYQLKELCISTKFSLGSASSTVSSAYRSSASQSPFSNRSSFSPSSSSTSSSSCSSSIDLYSKTIFNYLSDYNQLEYLALEDFTLRFPNDELYTHNLTSLNQEKSALGTRHDNEPPCKRKRGEANDLLKQNDHRLQQQQHHSNLKYLYLRNIRNVKLLSTTQLTSISVFLSHQQHLHTLDLLGLYLSSQFICSIIVNLNNLK
jgi:hypothetical protein